jgi:ubiquinone/menaquinone biosynthesis C-methylase UbiE
VANPKMATLDLKICPVCKGTAFTDFLKCRDHFVSGQDFLLKECSGCGLKITYQAPSEESIGPYYQSENYISHSNTSRGLVNRLYHFARNYMLGQKLKVVRKSSGKNVGRLLDVGAGTGYFAAFMQKKGWSVEGIEKSREARNFAFSEFGLKMKPAEELCQIEDNSYDVVTLWHVLEHIQDPGKNIRAIRRILNSDGTLFIALPNHESYDAQHYKKFWAAYDVPRHLWHFAPQQVNRIFERNGFRMVHKYRMPLDAIYISILSEKYKKSSLGLMRGLLHGKISWIVSMFDKNRCSSVIYVFKKA